MTGASYDSLNHAIDRLLAGAAAEDVAEVAAAIGAARLAESLQSTAVAASVYLLNGGDEANGREILRSSLDWAGQAARPPERRKDGWRLEDGIALLARIRELSGIPPTWPDWSGP